MSNESRNLVQPILRCVGVSMMAFSTFVLGILMVVVLPKFQSVFSEMEIDPSSGVLAMTPQVLWAVLGLVIVIQVTLLLLTWKKRQGGSWALMAGVAMLSALCVVVSIIVSQTFATILETIASMSG